MIVGATLTFRAEGDPLDDTPRPTGSGRTSPPPSSQPPSPQPSSAQEKVPQKKGPGKKMKKLGNNQYTKQRDLANQGVASSPHSKKRQLAGTGHTSSGDEHLANGDTHPTNTSNSTNKNSPGGAESAPSKPPGKVGKGKHKLLNGLASNKQPVPISELSVADMERRVDAMLAFMQRTQLEMASSSTPMGAGVDGGDAQMSGVTSQPVEPKQGIMEMADDVSRNLENWKRTHGVQAKEQVQ